MKIGRNDLCWCGSGRKYKKCHLNREEDSLIQVNQILKETKKAKEKYCLHPNASKTECNKIIEAHSIQRKNVLEKIALDGHVYNFRADLPELIKNAGILMPQKIGLNSASVFTGFCNYHDTETFKPIEKERIQICDEHVFLIAYRALCKEIYAKKFQQKMIPITKDTDKGQNVHTQIEIQSIMKIYESAVNAGLNDLFKVKKYYDEILLTKDYSSLRYYVIHINQIPEVLCSGQANVEVDFQGNVLVGIEEFMNFKLVLDRISFSIICSDDKGIIIFSCFNNEPKSLLFLQSIAKLNDTVLPNAIIRYCFSFYENTFMSPIWWENLNENKKKYLINRMQEGLDVGKGRNPKTLMADGINVVNWEVNKIVSKI